MIFILKSSVPIEVYVIVRLAFVSASMDMTVLLVKDIFVLRTAIIGEWMNECWGMIIRMMMIMMMTMMMMMLLMILMKMMLMMLMMLMLIMMMISMTKIRMMIMMMVMMIIIIMYYCRIIFVNLNLFILFYHIRYQHLFSTPYFIIIVIICYQLGHTTCLVIQHDCHHYQLHHRYHHNHYLLLLFI